MFTRRFAQTARLGALALAASLVLTACSLTLNIGSDSSPPIETESDSVVGEFTVNEVMFAQMMIPHHEQAVEMSQLALDRSTNEAIINLAGRIIAGQEPEIDTMQQWLDRADDTAWDGHMGSGPGNHMNHGGMGGMASETELRELASLESPDFDVMFLELMIDHHEGAIDMVRMISQSDHPEVSALAEDIVRVQREEIAEMLEIAENIREG